MSKTPSAIAPSGNRLLSPHTIKTALLILLCALCFSAPSLAQTQSSEPELFDLPLKLQSGQTSDATVKTESKKAFATEPPTNLNPTGNIFYVAPNGSPSGNGSLASPWDLKTALANPAAVRPGDTIYLRGGVYTLSPATLGFTSNLQGTFENPIKVMSRPGEWAVIDGNVSFSTVKSTTVLTISGSFTWFANFEITNTETATRKIDISGSNPPERRANSIDDVGRGTRLINLIIHDTGQGIGAWAGNQGENNEYYGNIVYNNGWDAPDRLHGHGNYVQNRTGAKLFEDNMFFNPFDFNSQVYGSSSSENRNLTWKGNVFFNGAMSWWGPNISNLKVTENFTYKQLFKLGNSMSPTNTDALIENNYFTSGVLLDEFNNLVTFKNNTIYNEGASPLLILNTRNFYSPGKFVFQNNTYFKSSLNPNQGQFRIDFTNSKKRVQIVKRYFGSFAFNGKEESQRQAYLYNKKSWQDDLDFDEASVFNGSAPKGVKFFVRPNRYDANRSHVIVYNWDSANFVDVDVNAVLSNGDAFELRNVQDYFGDVVTGVYTGGLLRINMVQRTRAKPIGYDTVTNWYHDPLKTSTFPTFGAFVLIKRTN